MAGLKSLQAGDKELVELIKEYSFFSSDAVSDRRTAMSKSRPSVAEHRENASRAFSCILRAQREAHSTLTFEYHSSAFS